MIENVNASKNPSNVEPVDYRKYIGVASINVVAVNPNNEKLRSFGWIIPEDADEPKYVVENDNGKSARVRFLVQIQDLEDKPVIPIDFWVRPDISVNRDNTKGKIIDAYGRTAWGTKEEIKEKKIPQYSSGPASISIPYKMCHPGEEELVAFLMKYLNITPLRTFNRIRNAWDVNKNPGRLTIDDWEKVCNGNITEIAQYVSLMPENCVKVILGIRQTDDNKTYQTFLNTGYIGNGATPDRNTGEYTTARKLIDKFFEGREDSPYSFSASPVVEWNATATEVKDNSDNIFESTASGNDFGDDLPFD